MPKMTQAEYAERKGVSPQYVNKLVKQGKIRKVGRFIDSKQADAAIKAFSRSGRVVPAQRKRTAKARPSAKTSSRRSSHRSLPTHSAPELPPTPSLPGRARGDATSSLTANRATREYYEALRAQHEYETSIGKLLPADQVIAAERMKNENISTLFRRMPSSIAPLVAMCTNKAEIEDLLRREIYSILEQLSRDPLGMAAREEQRIAESPNVLPMPTLPSPAPEVSEGASL